MDGWFGGQIALLVPVEKVPVFENYNEYGTSVMH